MKFLKLSVNRIALTTFCCLFAPLACIAQATPQPDVLLLVDGEKLIGHFESADATNVMFKSDIAGEVKVPWGKSRICTPPASSRSHKKDRHLEGTTIPRKYRKGRLQVADQKVTVTPDAGTPAVIPVANTENVIPQASFMNAFKRPGFKEYWHGGASLGFALVQSTQRSKNVTSSLNLVRTVPSEILDQSAIAPV